MFDRIMGRYLLEKGKVTKEQLSGVYQVQDYKRAKLGVIAVTEKLMSVAQAEEINALQATMDKRFGDLAIERGYLTNIQVGRLLSLQEDEFLTFSSAIVERGIMSLEELNNCINSYQEENSYTDIQMESLKHEDVNVVSNIYLGINDPEYLSLFCYGIKNFYRLVDTHVSIGKASAVHTMRDECLCYQKFKGDINATIAIVGKDADIQHMAKSYTKEEFIETKEDALDAMCELINCINGLYATEKSKLGIRIELEPPVFLTKFAEIAGNVMYSVPIYSGDKEISFVVAINNDVAVN